ncbi:M28 family peptidase [Luteolibacter flavescens]|uniref:M28 family peptidase n=1 Tax=Luteolibacter flavescens TaxID=1859460 RepID=A0ABT3FLM8_9BACT|nr:M28 family peptidase [Luteolibacter flavescens]MCW1884486.1 M28 family peptidase [Luteolibacter flavescens]
MKRFPLILLLLILAGAATMYLCGKPKPPAEPTRLTYQAIPDKFAAEFSGENAFKHVKAIVDLGPRPPASEGYEKTLQYLEKDFAANGWTTVRQKFTRSTPKGPIDFTNLLARHKSGEADWAKSTPVIIGGHLDSKKMDFEFVGANDGGSSTGVILEMARVLSADPASAAKVEFVLFDGEEALLHTITPTDGLYGSKHYAREMTKRHNWPAFGIVLDLVGDDDREFLYNPETPASFAVAVEAAARESGMTKLRRSPSAILDDHVPLQEAGLPCLHIIGDFMNMPYWHEPGDTMEVIDADALKKTGRTTLRFLAAVAQ